jgi:hypothetical protein
MKPEPPEPNKRDSANPAVALVDIQRSAVPGREGSLVAVLCEDGLCCAFSANNSCNEGKGVSPADGKRLALNIAVYALTH